MPCHELEAFSTLALQLWLDSRQKKSIRDYPMGRLHSFAVRFLDLPLIKGERCDTCSLSTAGQQQGFYHTIIRQPFADREVLGHRVCLCGGCALEQDWRPGRCSWLLTHCSRQKRPPSHGCRPQVPALIILCDCIFGQIVKLQAALCNRGELLQST